MSEETKQALDDQADVILTRLAKMFTDYKNFGFKNSAQVTKNIMLEIEGITGFKGPLDEIHHTFVSDYDVLQ